MLRITLRELEVFSAVCHCGSISAAADRLGLSQSAASTALAELERRLGVPLFDRIGKRVQANEHSRYLQPRVLDLLQQARALEDTFSSSAPSRLRIAASHTIGNYVLPALLETLLGEAPNDQYEMEIGNSQAVMTAIQESHADIGLIEAPLSNRNVVTERWLNDAMVVYARADHPLADRTPTCTELAGANWIVREQGSGVRQTMEAQLLPALGHLNVGLELGSGTAIRETILRGMGITCGSRRAVERELADGTFAEIRVPDLTLRRHFYIAWHAEKRLTAGAERLRRVCHALAAAEAGQAACA